MRAGAIWGRVAWTAAGREQVASRAYRFVSPVFSHTRTDNRIVALNSVGLTNTPNLTLTALNRRELETDMDELAELRSIVGLAADTSAQDVVAKVRDLATATASNRPDPAQYVPMAIFEQTVRELNSSNSGLTEELAEQRVERAQSRGAIPPFLREFGLSMCRRDPKLFEQFVSRTRGASYRADDTTRPLGLDRHPPGSRNTLSTTEQEIASRLGLTAAEMAGTKG